MARGFRVPTAVRWPGRIAAGSVSNDIVSHVDWLPTLLAAAGDPDVAKKLHDGWKVGGRPYHVRIDGYDQLPRLTGQAERGPRRHLLYFSDDGDLMAIRYDDWKIVYLEQRAQRFDVWREPFVKLRAAKIFNLRRDPFERADTDSNNDNHGWSEHVFRIQPAAAIAIEYMKTLREFPVRQRPASFNLDEVMRQLGASPRTAP